MNPNKEKHSNFNIQLTRLIGLYQILDPSNDIFCGYNVLHIIIVFFGVIMFALSMLLPIGLYYYMNDVMACIFYFALVENLLFSFYKIIIVIYNSKSLWKCIEVLNFNKSHKLYNLSIFSNGQKRSKRLSYIYIIMAVFSCVFWCASPCVLNKAFFTIRNIDGSYSKYRMNIVNIYLIAPDETYNKHFNKFYFIEIILIVSFQYFLMVFDTLTILMCFALTGQLETICDGIKALGHNVSANTLNINSANKLKKNLDMYDDLKMMIIDYQHVIQQTKKYFNIVRSTILLQIFVASSSHIVIWLIFSLNFTAEEKADPILSTKLMTILPLFTFQLFMACSLFGTINEKKYSIISALYSSNWMDMDKTSRHLILYTMRMYNANPLSMKVTNTKIVNLEMFTQTMRVCYSIFSMLINYNKKKE